jgi:hypothetical protein
MPRVQCQTCGGVYSPLQADGTEYYHACPPLSVPELKTAHAAKRLRFSAADEAAFQDALAADELSPAKPDEPSRVDRFLATLAIDRPNKRDERPVRVKADDDATVPTAAGLGEPIEIVDVVDAPTSVLPA